MEHGHVEMIYLLNDLNVLIFHSYVKLPAGKLHMISLLPLCRCSRSINTVELTRLNCQVKVSEVAGSLSAAETSIIFKCPVVDHSLLVNGQVFVSLDWFCWENLQKTMVFSYEIYMGGSCTFSLKPIH
jgi:hypothetical protein